MDSLFYKIDFPKNILRFYNFDSSKNFKLRNIFAKTPMNSF